VTSGLWLPGIPAGPTEDFVERVRRRIEGFATERGLEEAVVEVELFGGARLNVCGIDPEPGSGFVTLRCSGNPDEAEELIVPVGSIARIELHSMRDEDSRVGFSAPARG
jgi:hypothetical protein